MASFGGTYEACVVDHGLYIEIRGANREQYDRFLQEHPRAVVVCERH